MNELKPKDHAEEVATHRHAVIGPLCARELTRGDLAALLRELSEVRFRAPGADITRTYSVPTLERWYYAYRAQGLIGLTPRGRSDRGRGRKLTPALKTLICDIRREYPSASAKLIVRTLEADGRLERGLVKPGTVQKFLKQRGLDRIAVRDGAGATTRLRWQASAPDALWHADVCHGPTLTFGTMRTPIRVHGMLDDCSRYGIALEAHDSETELDMLRVFIRALRTHGRPDVLYLDNGSTYRGDVLRTVCARLGISLVQGAPGGEPLHRAQVRAAGVRVANADRQELDGAQGGALAAPAHELGGMVDLHQALRPMPHDLEGERPTLLRLQLVLPHTEHACSTRIAGNVSDNPLYRKRLERRASP